MANYCGYKLADTPINNALLEKVGSDINKIKRMLAEAIPDGNPTTDFVEWYAKTTNKSLDIKSMTDDAVADLIISYFKARHPSVADTAKIVVDDDKVLRYGYEGTFDREEGKRHAAKITLQIFNALQANNYQVKGNTVEYYTRQLRNNWNDILFEEIARLNDKTTALVEEEWNAADDKLAYMKKGLGGQNMSSTNKSRLAVYQELNGTQETAEAYMQELLCNPVLQDVYNQSRNDAETVAQQQQQDAVSELDGVQKDAEGNKESGSEPDVMITVLNNHIGAYSSFMMHVGPRIRNYFNTLEKLASTSKENDTYVVDTNNHYGIADAMDAATCSSMLYGSKHIFQNVDTMIKGIEDIGKRVPGFEAFVKFAEDLRSNPDFATEVFTVFAKTVISKLQVVVENGNSTSKIANKRSNKERTFMFALMNDARATSLENDADYIQDKVQDAISSINSIIAKNNTRKKNTTSKKIKETLSDEIDSALIKLKADTVKLIKYYFPSVQNESIICYIDLNNGSDISSKLNNISNLLNIVNNTAEASKKTQVANTSLQIQIEENIAWNKALDADKENGHWHEYSEYRPVKELFNTDYLDKSHIGPLNELLNALAPYSVVKLQINSPNVHGNNSSDVINNSHITNLAKMLDGFYKDANDNWRNPQLEQWGESRSSIAQYKYNPLLFEQYDEKGKPICTALFRRVPKNGGELVLTKESKDLLEIMLFDGSSDLDAGKNIIYPEMTEGDYLPTAFISFFNPDIDETSEVNKKDTANYFTRTPSDAPKIFGLRCPRYDTTDLIQPANDAILGTKAIQIVNSIPLFTGEEYRGTYAVEDPMEASNDKILDYIINGTDMLLPKGATWKELDDGTAIAVIKDKGNKAYYVFKGYLENRGKAKQLTDYEFVGVKLGGYIPNPNKPNEIALYKEIPEEIREPLISHYKEQLLVNDVTAFGTTYEQVPSTVNTNHPVFKMLYNQFMQELLDCATAMNEYFELDEAGWVKDMQAYEVDEDGKKHYVNSNDKRIALKEGKSNTVGYKVYHLDKDGKVLQEKDGKYTLGGKVFGSEKFTLSVTENGEVFKINYLGSLITTEPNEVDENGEVVDDGRIHILYGGGGVDSYLHMNIENGKVVDVSLTNSQNAAVEQAISEFIIDYNNQAQKKVRQFKNAIKGVTVDRLNITDFAMNNLLMFMNYDALFEGDTKFYPNSQTILKRAKEHQGSGIPYGIVDYNEVEEEILPSALDEYGRKLDKRPRSTDVPNSYLNQLSRNGEFDGTILEDIRQRKAFVGVTVKNTISTNEKGLALLKESLVQSLTPSMGKEAAEDHAMDILYGPVKLKDNGEIDRNEDGTPKRKGGFTETKVNDAQSYITFDEWVRRVAARGQLHRYLPLIKRILDERYINKNNPKDILSRADYLAKIKEHPEEEANYSIEPLSADDIQEFIQVQKNFYYDLHYDGKYGIYVPRQIKNAELVLVPRLIKGTQLETVYNLMKQAGVDQLNTVETSKAANEKVLTLWDNEGNLTGADTFVTECKDDDGGARQVYSYSNLYTQQETPQHVNSANKAGIQIMKKIIDNIPPTINGKKNPLYDQKELYFKLVVQNIRDSFESMMDDINVARDENGNIQFNADGSIRGLDKDGRQVFFNKLREEMLRLGLDDNMIDYVTLDPETGQPLMPAVTNSIITKFESVVQSMFNSNITRQKLPGFHAAQVTNVGWQSMGEQVQGRRYDANLEYHPMTYVRKNNSKDVLSQREYDKLPDNVKEQYQENGPAPYIEIMLPLSNFGIDRNSAYYKNMTDDQILAELKKEGLDIIMGYRIPTEGKQSVCNMRVVGFTPDSMGSTIVVPNDWVSQTGSDFDIDSVYGIHFATKTSKNGRVRKVQYVEELDNVGAYISYILSYRGRDLDKNTKGNIRKVVDSANKVFRNIVGKLNEFESKEYEELPEDVKTMIMRLNRKIDDELKRSDLSKSEAYAYRCRRLAFGLNLYKKHPAVSENSKAIIDNIVKTFEDINAVIEGDFLELAKDPNSKVFKIVSDELKNIEEEIKGTNILTFEEFKNAKPEEVNTRDARSNKILQIMIDILSDPSSLEENLSRSNFDDIIYWRNDIMNESMAAERDNRSPYNIFDQIAYQEDAMSGATLKGMSVALDTFCSVCNTVQAELHSDDKSGSAINIVYDAKDFDDPQASMSRFNAGTYKGTSTFRIKHTQYGWSNDNRNVSGKILTAYSSQTTAHILDAIKEGAIPNVNAYSFGVYKTLVNVGSDYKTAISFIMQPGVKRIVDNYNRNNSVFITSYDNPIHQALKELAKEAGIRVSFSTPITSIIKSLQRKYGKMFNRMFKQDWHTDDLKINFDDKNLENIPLIVPMLYDRIKEKGIFAITKGMSQEDIEKVEHLRRVFDIGVVLSYHKLNKTARSCGAIARCCNPDKFGAKQTVYSTNKVFDDMHELLFDNTEGNDEEKQSILTCKPKNGRGKNIAILKAIYPGIEVGDRENPAYGIVTTNRVEESKYPSLYAFLKYASATSTTLAKELFITQNPRFVNAIRNFTSVLSNRFAQLDEETYTSLQKYALSYYYNKVPNIVNPLSYDKDNNTLDYKIQELVTDKNDDPVLDENGEKQYVDVDLRAERARIYGFGHLPNLKTIRIVREQNARGAWVRRKIVTEFDVADINDPTQKEIDKFLKLSPAQKVFFIQSRFEDAGIFNRLEVTLHNPANRGFRAGMQTLEFREDNANPNTIFAEFNQAFYNSNPLVKIAAYDVIKYAILTEGLNMTGTGVSKTIPNKPLLDSVEDEGTGFISKLMDSLIHVGDINSEISNPKEMANLYENYIRSHPDIQGIKRINISTSTNRDKYGIELTAYGPFVIRMDEPEKEAEREKVEEKWREKMANGGFLIYSAEEKKYLGNKYIKAKTDKGTFIYKLYPIENALGQVVSIIGTPLNPLEKNEVTDISARDDNNAHWAEKTTYEYLVRQYLSSREKEEFNADYVRAQREQMRKEGNWKWASKSNQRNKDTSTVDFSIEELAEAGNIGMSLARDKIIDNFSKVDPSNLYLKSNEFTNYIKEHGPENASPQIITMPNGQKRKFLVTKVNTLNLERKYLLKTEDNKFVLSEADFNNRVQRIESDQIRQAIINAREQNIGMKLGEKVIKPHIGNFYVVTPFVATENKPSARSYQAEFGEYTNPDVQVVSVKNNTLEKLNTRALDFMELQSRSGDEVARERVNRMKYGGLSSNTISGDELTINSLKNIAAYAKAKAAELKDGFDRFIEDPTTPEEPIGILGSRVQKELEGNETMVNRYLQTINAAKAFFDVFSSYKAFEFTSEDPEIKHHMDSIKESFDVVAKLPIEQAHHAFAQGYATRLSKDPLIQDRIINIMDGYWQTYGAMWAFHSIMENGNPLLQIILTDALGDVDAKKKQAVDTIRNHHAKIRDIEARAREAGMPIDWTHVFDDNGTFVYDYSPEFIEDLNRLRDARDDAAIQFGRGSVEHLKANLAYDQFKAVHVNQAVLPEYYIQMCNLDAEMLAHHSAIFSAYKQLQFEHAEILEAIGDVGYTDDLRAKLENIKARLMNLQLPHYNDDGSIDEYQAMEAAALENYINTVFNLNEEYFKYEDEFGFQEQLERNLAIVRAEEAEDAFGRRIKSDRTLSMNEKYVAAKQWLQKNAWFKMSIKRDADGNPISIGAKIEDAKRRLNQLTIGIGGRHQKVMRQYIQARQIDPNAESVYDEARIIDGRKFDDAERASIKRDQQRRYNTEGMPIGTDTILISNPVGNRDVQYKAEFYQKLKTDGYNNPDYIKIVNAINDILEKYVDPVNGIVELHKVPDTPEGRAELEELILLYKELEAMRRYKKTGSTRGAAVAKFIDQEVDFVTDNTYYKEQWEAVRGNSSDYISLWVQVNLQYDEDGMLELDEEGNAQLNSHLHGYMQPKNPEKWIDEQKTKDLQLLDRYYKKTTTKYYSMAQEEARQQEELHPGQGIYDKWYKDNHIYNPYTRRMEPLECWLHYTPREELFDLNLMEGEWIPINNQRHKVPQDGKTIKIVGGKRKEYIRQSLNRTNPDYKENATLQENYRPGQDNGKYDSKVAISEYEKEMRDYLQQKLIDTSYHSVEAKRFFEKGNLPIERLPDEVDAKSMAKSLATVVGLNLNKAKEELAWKTEIGYDKDYIPSMPLTKRLFDEKLGSVDFQAKEPQRADYINKENGLEEYRKAHDEWKKAKEEAEAKNKEVSNAIRNKDWLSVIDRFIERAAEYNAIQDNKHKLYYLHTMLKQQEVMIRDAKGWFGNQLRTSTKHNTTTFEKAVDTNLVKQYEVFMRRFLWNQWKEHDSKKTNAMDRLQNFTSANYMMLNFKGGMANVTLGLTGMLAESAAGEYFGRQDWGSATNEYRLGITGFIRAMYEDISYNKQDAVAKYFLVVDYEEISGVPRKQTMDKWIERFRNAMFSPQTAGEHFMQTSVLFAMLKSHKLIHMPNDPLGIGYACMNESEYIRYKEAFILYDVLTEEQRKEFEDFKKQITSDPNVTKDYAWWRKDIVTEFVALHCNKEQRKRFVELRDKEHEKLRKEFAEEPDLYSQMKLGSDGKLDFVENSKLAALNGQFIQDGKLSKAHALMGRFAERVRKVNDKIHGVYNKSGQAYIEKNWWGSLVMQYHKHLPTGLAKRYRARGFFSETRGTKEKGLLWSVVDFLSLNHRAAKYQLGLSDANVEALTGVQNILKTAIVYCQQFNSVYHLLPAHERANIRRNIGDLAGTLVGLMGAIALMCGDDDDDNDGYWFNYWMYEADRLASESFLYNPIGLWTETKTLMSTPIAAQSVVSDIFSGAYNIAAWLATGDVESMTYKSGQFAGRNKLSVYFERRIPIWNGIRGVVDLPNNNHYYKRGKKVISIVPAKDIAHWIHEGFE